MRKIGAVTVRWVAAGIVVMAAVAMVVYRANAIEQKSVEAIDALLDCAFFGDEGDTCQAEERQLRAANGRGS